MVFFRLMRLLSPLLLLLSFGAVAQAQYVKVLGTAEQSGKIITSGVTSTTSAAKTFPGATVTIYSPSGSGSIASIFSASTGTAKANPFSASLTDATIDFFILSGSTFDIRISGVSGGVTISAFTRSGYTAPGTAGIALALCGGSADTSLLSALSALGGTIQIPKGITCASNSQTISAALQIDGGGLLKPITGQTVTLTGPQIGGAWRRFTNATSGLGTISFTGNYVLPEVYSEWWGAVADESADCLAAINSAMASFYHVRFLLAGYRVSGPVIVPNRVSLYGPQVANHQSYARLIANGSGGIGFTGNNLVIVNAPGGQYNAFQNLALYAKNISNASFVTFSITGLSESSFIKNIAVYVQNSSISRMFFFDTFGPLIIETLNIDIVDGTNSIANEPLYVNAPAGVIFRDLNYHLPAIAAKGIKITTGVFGDLSGLQIETHPTTASEPGLTLIPAYGVSLRDSRLNTSVASSTAIKIMITQPTVDFAGYNLDNITIDTAGGGTWDKRVVLENSLGTTKYWDTARLVTTASGQGPQRIVRFTPSEQIFNGVQSNYGPHTFRDTWLFETVLTNGTVVVPFNPRVGIGSLGAGQVLIGITGRITPTGADNSALLWVSYSDLAGGGITPTVTYLVGGPAGTTWNISYAAGQFTFTNKNANSVVEVVVAMSHSTTNLFP